ncbi:multiple sugar transport system substrate-binding protein [Fontibacillus solani]|uniref:Multiple sugar transport system substrate-binding protein n=1 Tax=Fontibacillus solani TaxID=1572857 RepID=A0A7W3XTJ6_9BACL|nr:extracellular solute-binding protein [Fontibacillus solani]MBA9087693.1 multiple sugar transport system substrate-binding protein [Fontibacillus solani]
MKSKKWFVGVAVMALSVGLLAGCGGNNNNNSSSSGTPAASETSEAKDVPAEGKEVSIFWSSAATENENNILTAFTEETGIKVNKVIIPGNGDESQQKIDISLVSGDTTDVIFNGNVLTIDKYKKGETIIPLNDLAAEAGYDADKVFGKYLPKDADGKYYGLPSGQTIWSVVYNKQIFDDAGVPYPEGNWTWDDYIKIAEKLTDPSKKIYGSYMLDYDNYNYILAKQQDVSAYKEDGTSNYDDPAFKESLQFFKDLGNKYKIQPSYEEFKTKKLPWDGFMQGNYGMHFISSWYLGLLSDSETYPRDWKYGIAPTPANANGQNNLVNIEYYSINKNAKNPKAAFELVKFLAENKYKYVHFIPARENLSSDDWSTLFADTAKQSGDNVTGDELYNAFINNGLGVVDEKISGSIPAEYSKAVISGAEKFYLGQATAEEAVNEIKAAADNAIAAAK